MMSMSFLRRLFDFICPRQCIVCGNRLSVTEKAVCGICNLRLPRTGFQHHALDNVMARLFWGQVPVERVASLFFFEHGSESSSILYELKYHDRPDVGELMGQLMAREFMSSGFFEGMDAIVPVPLAAKRERQRGYNQSLMLARGMSEVTGLPVVTDAVCRTRFVESQTMKGRWERLKNVGGVFRLCDGKRVEGLHVLVVDDVVTTGSTAIACIRELQKACDVKVSVVSLAFAKS